MGEVIKWSELPEELVNLIANRLSSNVELLCIRSICKPWRSAVVANKGFPNRLNRLESILLPRFNERDMFLASASIFRVTQPSSCPNKGWLTKTRQVSVCKPQPESQRDQKLSPFSRYLINPSHQTLDLLNFAVSEIRQPYNAHCKVEWSNGISTSISLSNKVVVTNRFLALIITNEIWWCTSGETTPWKTIRNEQGDYFFDIILHEEQIYGVDINGSVWGFSLPQLNIFQYGPSTPSKDDDFINCTVEKRLVDYCGELCVVHHFRGKRGVKRNRIVTVGFKVYKIDKELARWVKVDSLGDKALIVDSDSCFTVSASEYYGCLEDAIYFNDGEDVSVFKLDDGSIITKKMIDSSSSSQQSCFQLFSAPFL